MLRRLIAVGLVLVFGAAKLPYEKALDSAQRMANFRSTKLDLNLREQVGQLGFLAALSGFRSPLAAILWLEAYTAWENTEWGRMAGLFNTVTTLQPRSVAYWDLSGWHMAYNASVAALENPKEPSQILRERRAKQYIEVGRDYLERGIKNNPDRFYLYERLGVLLRDKLGDHCAAAKAFQQAVEKRDAPEYLRRFVGYELAQCPGHEREAYDYLRKLYEEGEGQRLPSLIRYLKELEVQLNVPEAERIKEKVPE